MKRFNITTKFVVLVSCYVYSLCNLSYFYLFHTLLFLLSVDAYDFTGDLDISFWILPDLTYHNGPLFNVGSEDNFKYYEWKTKAVKRQFMVVEITYEAVNVFQYQIPFNGSGLALLLLFAFRLPV